MAGPLLVVEDDRAIADLVGEALGDQAFAVEYAATDREAYARIPAPPTLSALIVDVNLGAGTTGYDVARFARRKIPGLPVFYISGAALPDSHLAFGVPDSDFIPKPFHPDELARRVALRLAEAGRTAR